MFFDQLFHFLWMMVPIVLVLGFRIKTPFVRWELHNLWGLLIAVLLSTLVFSITFTEIPFFPSWTLQWNHITLLVLWVVYGQLCANLGRLGGLSPRLESFVYGALCGLWACAQTYKQSPRPLSYSVCGAFLGRIGVPIFLLVPAKLNLIAFSVLAFSVLLIFVRIEEDLLPVHKKLALMTGCTWCFSWYDPLIGLSIGVVLGLVLNRSFRGWQYVLTFLLFGLYQSSFLAGIGVLELLSRYMEGGVLGEQSGLTSDILIFGFLFSFVSDPVVSTLSTQALWERSLDVQQLHSMQGLFLSAALGQIFFVFYAAGCVRKGKWLLLALLSMCVGYLIAWGALL